MFKYRLLKCIEFVESFEPLTPIALDVLILVGMVEHLGHFYLKHAADPRRFILILGLAAYWLRPSLRARSICLSTAEGFIRRLLLPQFRWSVFGVLMALSIALTCAQALALRVPLYDVGIFHQILWSLSRGLGFHSSISGAGNFLLDHFSPSLILLLPPFVVSGGSPLFLPVLQAVLLWTGVSAWVYAAERMPKLNTAGRNQMAAAVVLFTCCFDSLWGNLAWGFHENAIAFAAFSWALALIVTERRIGLAIGLIILASLTKEILLLDGALLLGMVALFYPFPVPRPDTNSRRFFVTMGLLLLALCGVAGFIYFESIPHLSDKNYFLRYYSYIGSSLPDAFHNLLTVPAGTFWGIPWLDLVKYVWRVFSPWLFIPLLFMPLRSLWQIRFPLAIIPSFLSAGLATYPPLRNINFHYVLELWPFLAIATLFYISQFPTASRRLILWLWVCFAAIRMDHDPIGDLRAYIHDVARLTPVREKLQAISSEDSVMASELAGPWIAGRKWITRMPDSYLIPRHCPDWLVLQNIDADEELKNQVTNLILKCGIDLQRLPNYLKWKEQGWAAYQFQYSTTSHIAATPLTISR